MKFSTVEIRPSNLTDPEWEVRFVDLPHERVNEGIGPSGLGFYHYPRKMGKKKAFEILKKHLVEEHEKRIVSLAKSLAKLEALGFSEV